MSVKKQFRGSSRLYPINNKIPENILEEIHIGIFFTTFLSANIDSHDIARGSTKKSFTFRFLQESFSEKKFTITIENMVVYSMSCGIFSLGLKRSKILLLQHKIEIGSSKLKINLFFQCYKDIIELSYRQTRRLPFRFENELLHFLHQTP